MESDISQKVIEKIKNQKIEPKPRWMFVLCRSIILWLAAVFLIIAAISLGIIFDLFSEFEIDGIMSRPQGMKILFLSLPYLWIIFIAIFTILAAAEFVKTRSGYRYRLLYVGVAVTGVILFLSLVLHALGYCSRIEDFFEVKFPFYSKLINTPQQVWSQPERGLLSGMVIFEDSRGCNCLGLLDWEKDIWDVNFSNIKILPLECIQRGKMIKVIGRKLENHNFEAEEIRPWLGRRMEDMRDDFEEDFIISDRMMVPEGAR